jgi:hypothetical protein
MAIQPEESIVAFLPIREIRGDRFEMPRLRNYNVSVEVHGVG